ncbi:SEC-C metal-binding domain-containing protein [Stutzerimonas stutzeri]|uniref:SEC-C metal-binding domain-containing protein n=1 Tax=Stutzerimonas stutzeri TaxID=316 RepID=UPI00210D0022|nr:SEC-C metal-binding domain-containing protein [Stutzerimonas stutzeri]MCQ4321502.1 SEC-C metal-binding domain-containing protein [Stutzerimonas stutzeri]
MNQDTHVHGPDCSHDDDHDHAPHVHGPHCSHSHDPVRNPLKDVGRNDPCPCGSQKKFKKCHGA